MEGLDAIEKDYTYESYQITVFRLLRWVYKRSERMPCKGLPTASLQNGQKTYDPVTGCPFLVIL